MAAKIIASVLVFLIIFSIMLSTTILLADGLGVNRAWYIGLSYLVVITSSWFCWFLITIKIIGDFWRK